MLFAVVHLWPAAALLALSLVASRVNAWAASVRKRIAFERVERWRADMFADANADRAATMRRE